MYHLDRKVLKAAQLLGGNGHPYRVAVENYRKAIEICDGLAEFDVHPIFHNLFNEDEEVIGSVEVGRKVSIADEAVLSFVCVEAEPGKMKRSSFYLSASYFGFRCPEVKDLLRTACAGDSWKYEWGSDGKLTLVASGEPELPYTHWKLEIQLPVQTAGGVRGFDTWDGRRVFGESLYPTWDTRNIETTQVVYSLIKKVTGIDPADLERPSVLPLRAEASLDTYWAKSCFRSAADALRYKHNYHTIPGHDSPLTHAELFDAGWREVCYAGRVSGWYPPEALTYFNDFGIKENNND